MNAKQIATTLKNKGFETKVNNGNVTVSLTNRKPSNMEVKQALDYQITAQHIFSTNNAVIVIGMEI